MPAGDGHSTNGTSGPVSVRAKTRWKLGELEATIAFHAVEGRGVSASFPHDELARICPDVAIFA